MLAKASQRGYTPCKFKVSFTWGFVSELFEEDFGCYQKEFNISSIYVVLTNGESNIILFWKFWLIYSYFLNEG